MRDIEEVRTTIEAVHLGDDGLFAPRLFESCAVIYRVRLGGSFLETLINGPEEEVKFWARPGRNRYSEVLRWLGLLTGGESAFWFYICNSQQGKSQIKWVKAAHTNRGHDARSAPLAEFEKEPATSSGGAHLGLLGDSAKWMLLHTHYPEEEFEISIHGSSKLCDDLCKLVKSVAVLPEEEV